MPCALATRIDPRDETNYLDVMSLSVAHEDWDLSLENLRRCPGKHCQPFPGALAAGRAAAQNWKTASTPAWSEAK
jgi:hypothetical protein